MQVDKTTVDQTSKKVDKSNADTSSKKVAQATKDTEKSEGKVNSVKGAAEVLYLDSIMFISFILLTHRKVYLNNF